MTTICTMRHRPYRYCVYSDNRSSPLGSFRYRWAALTFAPWHWLNTTSTITVTDEGDAT